MFEPFIRKCLRPIKRTFMFLLGRDCFFKPDVQLEQVRFGSDYGGWQAPANALMSDSIVYSAGIGTDISFDTKLIEQAGACVFAFDPTPASLEWLKAQQLPDQFKVHPIGLADYDGTATFHIPKNPNHVSHSIIESQVTQETAVEVEVMRICSLMEKLGHTHLDLLKMDIEGAEYAVVANMLASNLRPIFLLIEFHHRFSSIGAKKTKACVNALRKAGYKLYSVSPSGEELCFILHSALPGVSACR